MRALVGTHQAGYLSIIPLPSDLNGAFALTLRSKVGDNTISALAFRVEVYEDDVLKWSYEGNANQYPAPLTYRWWESPTWVFDGTKTYTLKLYWGANVDFYAERLCVMARRGGIGYGGTYPSSMIFRKAGKSAYQVGYYTRKSDGSYSWIWFSSAYTVPVDGNFHLVAVTLKDGVKSLFIDGELKQQVTGQGDLYRVNTYFRIGTVWRNFHGLINDVRVYKRALSPEEIYDIFDIRRNIMNGCVLKLGTVGLVRGGGTKWLDESPYKNHGTVYGAKRVRCCHCNPIMWYGTATPI